MSGAQLIVPTLESIRDPGIDHGEVFTRRWVAELVLDLADYRIGPALAETVVVEPSCGSGAFVIPVVERLIESVGPERITECRDLIRAFDLLEANTDRARKAVLATLVEAGVPDTDATSLAGEWVRTGDFLLDDLGLEDGSVDLVVGNPPYVRLESVDPSLMPAYRDAMSTMRGRSDLYVGFYERGLGLLDDDGRVAFICADRWMHNQYGADLRDLITTSYAVESIVSMHDVDAFLNDVAAYPAITVLRRAKQASVLVTATSKRFDQEDARQLVAAANNGGTAASNSFSAARLPTWSEGPGLWPSGTPEAVRLVQRLEANFPPLQDAATGTRVGVGVATGADDVYITSDPGPVEPDRLLPLATSADIASGRLEWSGRYLVNPWSDDGLVDLAEWPGLHTYLSEHEAAIRQRYVARQRPRNWYRTIDRVKPSLTTTPKLLFQDMKASAHPVLDPGGHYPSHNLYYVVSTAWDLEVLGGLLLSDVANLFISTYCVKMRGGTYRFQAQYLRMIRVPEQAALGRDLHDELRTAFRSRDTGAATRAACKAYGIGMEELSTALHGTGSR